MHFKIRLSSFLLVSTTLFTTGLSYVPASDSLVEQEPKRLYPRKPYYETGQWAPKDFFTDPLAIQCASAIARNDKTSVDELIAKGLDVNHKGKHNCTLLLWAYSSPKIQIFKALLEAGANPNVPLTGDIDNDNGDGLYREFLFPGRSVTSICCISRPSDDWFELVFKNGGDPNFTRLGKFTDNSVLHAICTSSLPDAVCQRRINTLCELGGQPNTRPKNCLSPLAVAINSSKYGTALALIDNGADMWLCIKKDRHHVVPMHSLAEKILESEHLYGTQSGGKPQFPYRFVKNPSPNFQPLISRFIENGVGSMKFRRALRDASVAKIWSKRSSTSYWDLLPVIHKLEDEALGVMHPRRDWLRPRTQKEIQKERQKERQKEWQKEWQRNNAFPRPNS